METSLCSYSFHRKLEAGRHDVFQYIADCQALGCTQLDIWNGHLPALLDQAGRVGVAHTPDDGSLLPDELAFLAQVRAAAAAAGLTMGCVAVDGTYVYEPTPAGRGFHHRRSLRWLDIAARLGARQVRIDSGGTPEMPEEMFEAIVAGYHRLLERADDLGVEVVMENHWGASRVAANVVRILEAVPGLRLLFDSGNWQDGEHEAAWAQCARYAAATHIKTRSFDAQGNETTWNIPVAVRHLLDGGYAGCWGIESVPAEGDEFEAAQRSLALIRRLVSGQEAAA